MGKFLIDVTTNDAFALLVLLHPLTYNRNVGNTMAAFVMQVLGCEVAALNTVQFSINSTTYFLLPDN